jgi:hypothetical protein
VKEKKELYIGIDLGYDRAMVSLYHAGMTEPETVSTVLGEEKYQIPTAVFNGKSGSSYYGDEAIRRETHPDGEFYDNLYEQALSESGSMLYHNLLVQYIRRLIRLRERYNFQEMKVNVGITVPEITPQAADLFSYVREQLDLEPAQFMLMEYSESFFAHTYHQDASIWMHDVALFDYTGDTIQFLLLHRKNQGKIQLVTSTQKSWQVTPAAQLNLELRDEFFANVLREALMKRVVSSVYFIGEGFDGNWLRESLRVLGPNKRAFLGKNLYTRGACMAVYRRAQQENWNFFFDCSYKMQGEISMKVQSGEEKGFLRIVNAGGNWFDATEEYTLIYGGDPKVEIWIRTRGQLNAKIRTFELDDLPNRPPKTIRLKVRATPVSGNRVVLKFWDDGFGELFENSGKTWSFPLDF